MNFAKCKLNISKPDFKKYIVNPEKWIYAKI